MKILILGTTGMLGNTLFRVFFNAGLNVWGTIRGSESYSYFEKAQQEKIISNIDVLNSDNLNRLFLKTKPDIIINCVGIIKQQGSSKDPLLVLPINSMLPHRLSELCELIGARLLHISTDCVFSGKKGMYSEEDISDAEDLYGKSKYIGEIYNQKHVLTIRTSIIGHELNSTYSLVDWFLSQTEEVKGYTKVIFSGFPTVEIANIIKDKILQFDLFGLYHLAANPITKYDLLKLVGKVYGKKITITPSEEVQIDRSLNGKKFYEKTGYSVPDWNTLIERMYKYKKDFMGIKHV